MSQFDTVKIQEGYNPDGTRVWWLFERGAEQKHIGVRFFTRSLQRCKREGSHDYPSREEAEAALARLHFRAEHPNMPQEWYERNEPGARRAEAPSLLQALSSYVAVRFPGHKTACVQVSGSDGLWHCAVHSYPLNCDYQYEVEVEATRDSLDEAIETAAKEVLSQEDEAVTELRRVLEAK